MFAESCTRSAADESFYRVHQHRRREVSTSADFFGTTNPLFSRSPCVWSPLPPACKPSIVSLIDEWHIALRGGVYLLAFTGGGIGEHSEYIRSAASAGLETMGLTTEKIQIVATEEENQIARHCRTFLVAHP